MVADSTTMQSLPNVNIKTKNSSALAVSDIRGHFSITVSDDDTLVFSMVGYYSKTISAKLVKEVVIIFMTEEQKILNPVVIDSEVIIPWLKKLPPESPWRNTTHNIGGMDPPGFQGIPTFGPGYVLRGAISRHSKYEKERKKLKKVQAENYNSMGYVELVNSPEVKDKIMKDYNLTEAEYYRILAAFNEKNKDFIYELEPNEVISLLLIFHSEKAKKK